MLSNLQSPDNAIRKQAEAELQAAAEQTPEQLLEYLLQQITDPTQAEFASVILSKTFFENESNLSKLSAQQVNKVVTLSAECLKCDNKLSYLKRMCDLAVKGLLKFERYDDMTVLLFQIAQTATTLNLRLATMYFIEIMCEFAFSDDLLVQNAEKLNQIFTHYFNDSDPQVRCATLKSMTTFLVSIEEEPLLNRFSGVISTILQQTMAAIQVDQNSSVVALQSLTELLENHPKFLKNAHGDLLNIYTQLFLIEVVPDLRKQALHGLQTLCACAPAFVRKAEQFKTQTIPALMSMLQQVERKDWEATFDDNCLQLNDISSVAEDCLGKMVKDLTVKFLLPLFVPHIMKALNSQSVNEQHAGLIAMATLSDSAAEHFKSELPNIMGLILPLATSQNKLIIYDLLTCLACLCQEFTPTIQNDFGTPILNLIVQCMQQTVSKKVQYMAIACLVDFTRELCEDKEAAKKVLGPVAGFLIEHLYRVIEANLCTPATQQQLYLAEQALAAFSALADSLQDQFTQYYDAMMPFMMKHTAYENTQIRSLLVECMGCFVVSISTSRPQQCKQDADTLVKAFLQQQQMMEADDSQHTSIFYFYTQVATALKHDFGCYLEQIIPLVEKAMRMDIGFKVNSEEEGKNIKKVRLDLKFIGVKNLSLNTSALEQKVEGARTLLNLAEQCGKSFFPYIPRAVQLIKEFINYKYSSEIQRSMSQCVQYCMRACTLTVDMVRVFEELGPYILSELKLFLTNKYFDRAATIASDLADCINLIRQPLPRTEELYAVCLQAMNAIQKQKDTITYEDEDQYESDCADIDDLMTHITNIATELISIHKCEAVQQLMPLFYAYLTSKSSKSQTVNAIAFFNIVLPLCNETVFTQAQTELLKCYSGFAKTGDLEMKQNILFGYGNFAKRIPNLDAQSVLELAGSIIEAPDARSMDKVSSYETALTTIGKVGMYCNLPQSQELISKFLTSLPHEYQDAQETHLMLLKEVQSKNQRLLANQEQLRETLTRIRNQDTNNPENELLCDEGRTLIQQLLC